MKPFSDYMTQWLYGEKGYYASMPKIGKDGDFYTSVSTSIFFGGSIANYLLSVVDGGFLSPSTAVVEIGAHRGYMMADMIQFIYTLRPEFLETLSFVVVEPLDNVREAQREYFASSFGNKVNINIVKSLKELNCDEAFVVSNELFDAFTCELIHNDKMLYIHEGRAVFGGLSSEAKELKDKYNVTRGEVSLGVDGFVKQINKAFKKYEFVSFDYGQMGARGEISLRVYKNHKSYPFFELTTYGGSEDSFSKFFANSDITYDVNFTQIKDEFDKHGARLKKFCTQMVALSDFGISDLLEILHQNVDEKAYVNEVSKVKQLLLPEYLGERFKMINFTKG